MPKSMMIAFLVTDLVFLLYWLISGLALLGVLNIPPDWMYADYDKADVVAWNWSFLPVDLGFSALGLMAVSAARRGAAVWRPLALVSMTFTMAAGGMAISYWALLGEFDPSWFFPNLALVIWPLFFLPPLIRSMGSQQAA